MENPWKSPIELMQCNGKSRSMISIQPTKKMPQETTGIGFQATSVGSTLERFTHVPTCMAACSMVAIHLLLGRMFGAFFESRTPRTLLHAQFSLGQKQLLCLEVLSSHKGIASFCCPSCQRGGARRRIQRVTCGSWWHHQLRSRTQELSSLRSFAAVFLSGQLTLVYIDNI